MTMCHSREPHAGLALGPAEQPCIACEHSPVKRVDVRNDTRIAPVPVQAATDYPADTLSKTYVREARGPTRFLSDSLRSTNEEWRKRDPSGAYLVSEAMTRAGLRAEVEAGTILSMDTPGMAP